MALTLTNKTDVHPRTLIILLAAGGMGSLAVLPYFISLFAQGQSLVTLTALTAVFSAASVFAVILGLRWGTGFGLGAPRLQNWAWNRADPGGWRSTFQWSVPIGLVLGAIIYIADHYWFAGAFQRVYAEQAWWKRAGAAIYGGTSEELLLRLFAMTAFVRILSAAKVTRTNAVVTAVFWSALLSMAVHLPAGLRYEPPSAMLFGHTLAHHGVSAAVYGWLFWRRGIESAMTAHGIAELVVAFALGSRG